MRIKRPPPQPPQAYRPPPSRGPTTLGARQSEYATRARQAWAGKSRGGKGSKRGGIHDSEIVTEFDEAMDEAYDRLLGRPRREQQQQQQQQGEAETEDPANASEPTEAAAPGARRELPAAFRFTPVRLKG